MSTPQDSPAHAGPTASRAISDETAAPSQRPVMGRPRPTPRSVGTGAGPEGVPAATGVDPARTEPRGDRAEPPTEPPAEQAVVPPPAAAEPPSALPGSVLFETTPIEEDQTFRTPFQATPGRPVDVEPVRPAPTAVPPGTPGTPVEQTQASAAGDGSIGDPVEGLAEPVHDADAASPATAAGPGDDQSGARATADIGATTSGGPGTGAVHAPDDSISDEPAGRTETAAGDPVRRPDQGARREAVARVSELAVPVGGLGSLAELGCWLAACQGECPPRPPIQAHVLLLAADHGVAAAGVSAYAPEVGRCRAVAAVEGRLPVAVAARAAGAAVRTVDVGLLSAVGPDEEHVVVRGTGRIDREDALTEEQAERAYRIGQLLADAEIDAGADVLVPGSLAVGATTPAAVLVAALTGAEPVAVVGRGSGIDDAAWMRKAAVIRDGLRRARPHVGQPLELLRRVGGTDIVVLAGVLARAADRKVPVVLDGLAVGAAALLAEELAPGAREWWLMAQASSEPAMTLVCEHLSLAPVLDLGIRTDDGTAAVAVLPLLVTAARLVAETGTAADTGIAPSDAG